MNGFAEEPMVSGAAWQRTRNLRPAASNAHHYITLLPPQLYPMLLTTLRYLNIC